jgi:C-terminal processing protease CtpA/Prc
MKEAPPMRHSLLLIAPLAMFALASQAVAGGAGCAKAAQANTAQAADHKGCTATKEECLAHMADAKKHGWVGIQYDKTEDGNMVVEEVVAGSPAAKAGLKPGDVLYALNGVPFTEANQDRLKAIKSKLEPGSSITYTIQRAGASKDVALTLGTMPDAVYQAMVQEHMKEHVDVASR